MSAHDRFHVLMGSLLVIGLMACGGGGGTSITGSTPPPAGALDTSFGGGDGKVSTDMGGGSDVARRVAIQRDGKIVVIGTGHNGTDEDFAIARYNANGTLDGTFSGDGKLLIDFSRGRDSATDVVIDDNDKIVVVGWANLDDFAVARVNGNGTLDESFNGTGKVTTDVSGASAHDQANGVALQASDGKIVVTGYADMGTYTGFALVRYNTNGTLDTDFNGDGIVTTDVDNFINGGSNHSSYAFDVALQPVTEKIIVGGYAFQGGNTHFAVAQYGANGMLDPDFNGAGIAWADSILGAEQEAYSLALQAGGKILLGGYMVSSGPVHSFKTVRFTSTGVLDLEFNGLDQVITSFGSAEAAGQDLAIDSQGRVVAVGFSTDGGGKKVFTAVRYDTNGSPDTSFDGDGVLFAAIDGLDSGAYGVALQADGKLVVVGKVVNGSDSDFGLIRVWP